MPLWQIRAERITHDQLEKEFNFEDASFEFLGRQVLYLPYFSQADPTVTTQERIPAARHRLVDLSRFLHQDSLLHLAQPFAGHHDRSASSRRKRAWGCKREYRQRWNDSGLWFQNTVGYDPGAAGKPGRSTWNSSLFGSGRFDMSKEWRSGFDVQLTSNDTYLQRYELSYLDRFTSNAFIEQHPRPQPPVLRRIFLPERARARRAGANSRSPSVCRIHAHSGREDRRTDGFASIRARSLSRRDIGTDVVRGSAAADWRAPVHHRQRPGC